MASRKGPRTSHEAPFVIHIEVVASRVENPRAYPFAIPAVRELGVLRLHPRVTYFVGENGSGKSTLVEAIAVAMGLNAEGGSQNFNFATRRSESPLGRALRIARTPARPRTMFFLRAESYFNVATNIEVLDRATPGPPLIASYGGRSLHEQSHGESFLALLKHRFGPGGFYVLDEPEAALSPARQIDAIARIHELVAEGSQFVIATHAPILLSFPNAAIYELDGDGIHPTRYDDTATVRVTRDFFDRRK
ncbi:MAG TPA: AAA family ATPase [Polyangiaceae bacterium]|jgi:predicted ATPase